MPVLQVIVTRDKFRDLSLISDSFRDLSLLYLKE